MLKDQGNIIKENIPITKELLDFALANNYKISLKNGDYSKFGLDINLKLRNNKTLLNALSELYLQGSFYYTKYCGVFGITKAPIIGAIKNTLKDRFIPATVLYPEEIQEQHKSTMMERHGVEYASQSPAVREKVKQTNQEKFGADCNLSSKEFREHAKRVWIEKYGVDNPMKSPVIQNKAKETNLERLGVEYPQQSKQVKAKSITTNIEKYGADNPMKTEAVQRTQQQTMLSLYGEPHALKVPELKDKLKATNIEKYGTPYAAASPVVRERIHSTNIEKYGSPYYHPSFHDTCNALKDKDAIERFKTLCDLAESGDDDALRSFIIANYHGSRVYYNLKKYGLMGSKERVPSMIELKVREYLTQSNFNFIENYRPEWMRHPETQRVRELDFLLPDFNLAIELNGTKTHSIEYNDDKGKHYHSFKFERCFENNIKLLMFTEEEVMKHFDLVCNLIEYHTSDKELKFVIEDDRKLRFGLKSQEISESTKVELFKVGDLHHYYPV